MCCPGCGEGRVYAAKVKGTSERFFICEECDAVWFHDGGAPGDVIDFASFTRGKGLPPSWQTLEITGIVN